MKPRSWLSVGCLLVTGCVVPAVELVGKQCPCAAPLVCEDSTQRCVSPAADLAGASDGSPLDMSRAQSLFDNGDYELPTPLPGCQQRQAGIGIDGSYGCRLCAVDQVGAEFASVLSAVSSYVTTGRYRFEVWVSIEDPATTLAAVSIEARDANAMFAGVTAERFSNKVSGWQPIVVHLDPTQEPTVVGTATVRLEAKLRVYGGATMGCVRFDDWYVGPE